MEDQRGETETLRVRSKSLHTALPAIESTRRCWGSGPITPRPRATADEPRRSPTTSGSVCERRARVAAALPNAKPTPLLPRHRPGVLQRAVQQRAAAQQLAPALQVALPAVHVGVVREGVERDQHQSPAQRGGMSGRGVGFALHAHAPGRGVAVGSARSWLPHSLPSSLARGARSSAPTPPAMPCPATTASHVAVPPKPYTSKMMRPQLVHTRPTK